MAHGVKMDCNWFVRGASNSNLIVGYSSVNVAGFLFPFHIVYGISNTLSNTPRYWSYK